MRSRLLIIFSLLLSVSSGVWAQSVGVLTDRPHASAALDVDVASLPDGSKKGMIFPQVALKNKKDKVTVPNPAAGLVVFNTQDAGSGDNAVEANMFYFWDGAKWLDMTNMDIVIRELFPQVFLALVTDQQFIGNTVFQSEGTLVQFPAPKGPGNDNPHVEIRVNTGRNIYLDSKTHTFRVQNTGHYEISGAVGYRPQLAFPKTTNLEFIIQRSKGTRWENIARVVSAWGEQTTLNSRHLVVSPVIVELKKGDVLRAVVKQTRGDRPHADHAVLNPAGGVANSKLVKIQRLD